MVTPATLPPGPVFCRVRASVYGLPYDFWITRTPLLEADTVRLARAGDDPATPLYRCSAWEAIRHCNALSRRNGLPPAYDEATGTLCGLQSPDDLPCLRGLRLPTLREWDLAAHGWSGTRSGDYFALQRTHYKVPGLDFPTTAVQERTYAQGYSHLEELLPNGLGLLGLVGHAREWCADPGQPPGQYARWDEYFTNYDNAVGYAVVSRSATRDVPLPWRLVCCTEADAPGPGG